MKFHPLEKVRTIIQYALGLDIMYAYDDLVFSDYGTYLFQFDNKKENKVHCYFNQEFDQEKHCDQLHKLKDSFRSHDFDIEFKGKFTLTQINDEVKIEFIKP